MYRRRYRTLLPLEKRGIMSDFLAKANSGVLYLVAIGVVVFILAQCLFFMVRAYREGLRIGMEKKTMWTAITSSSIFSVVPSIGILLGVIALSGSLGVPLPWIRLTVVGALHYEVMAADIAVKAAGLPALAAEYMTPQVFVTAAFAMTMGIIWGIVFILLAYKQYQKKLKKSTSKDNRWGNILFLSMFIGMTSAYVGSAFADVRRGDFTSLIVVIVSGISMYLFTVVIKKFNQKWLENFSLAFSMIIGMAAAVLIG